MVVFYGSQTGTAEEFATRLAKDASRYGMKGMVADPEECEMVGSCLCYDRNNGSGLIRELRFNAKPIFYPCTVFHLPLRLPEDALNYCWLAGDCIVYCKMGRVTGDNSIVNDWYCLAMDCAHENWQLWNLTLLM